MWNDFIMENYWSIVLYVAGAWVFFNKTKITHDKIKVPDIFKFLLSFIWPVFAILMLFKR